jgi:hypothetical protein
MRVVVVIRCLPMTVLVRLVSANRDTATRCSVLIDTVDLGPRPALGRLSA